MFTDRPSEDPDALIVCLTARAVRAPRQPKAEGAGLKAHDSMSPIGAMLATASEVGRSMALERVTCSGAKLRGAALCLVRAACSRWRGCDDGIQPV